MQEREKKPWYLSVGKKWVANQFRILITFYGVCEKISELEKTAEAISSQFIANQAQNLLKMTVKNFTKIFGGDPEDYFEMQPLTFFAEGARFALKQRAIILFQSSHKELSTGQFEEMVDAIKNATADLGYNKKIPTDLLAAFIWFRNIGLREALVEVSKEDAS